VAEPERTDQSDADLTMDELRVFVSLRALAAGEQDIDAFRILRNEAARLEMRLAEAGEPIEAFRLEEADLDNLYMLKMRQSLQPEGKVARFWLTRWFSKLFSRLFLGTQIRFNGLAAHMIGRLYCAILLTRWYQLRSLELEKRLDEISARLARLEGNRDDPALGGSVRSDLPPEPQP